MSVRPLQLGNYVSADSGLYRLIPVVAASLIGEVIDAWLFPRSSTGLAHF